MRYIILLGFLFLIPVSHAEIYAEPYGSIGGSYAGSKVFSRSLFLNYALGGRVGYRFMSVATGLDLFWTHYSTGNGASPRVVGIHSSPPLKGFNQAKRSVYVHYSSTAVSFQPFSVGVFAVVDLPILFNAYGTVFYSLGTKSSINHQGYGAKAGISYLSAFYVQVNLELQWSQYICDGKKSSDCMDHKNFNIISAMLSVSVPLSDDIFDFGRSEDSEEEISEVEESGLE